MLNLEKPFILDKNSVFCLPEVLRPPVRHTVDILFRDFKKVFGSSPKISANSQAASVRVRYASEKDPVYNRPEAFVICFDNKNRPNPPVEGRMNGFLPRHPTAVKPLTNPLFQAFRASGDVPTNRWRHAMIRLAPCSPVPSAHGVIYLFFHDIPPLHRV